MEQQMHGGHRPVLRPDRGRVVQNFLPSGGTWWRESVHPDRSPSTFQQAGVQTDNSDIYRQKSATRWPGGHAACGQNGS